MAANTDVNSLPEGGLLLDVREDDEWAAGHAPNAKHIPMSGFVARKEELGEPEGPVYVICRAGSRSAQVADYLSQNGVEAVNVTGGMQAWAAAGKPVVTDSGDAGTVI
ncbi:MAG: rhodanese-like domain-containing protein [Catenulispora sp.]|nr:rhodanese-like domain-containing protein [Catenulispora sp.]